MKCSPSFASSLPPRNPHYPCLISLLFFYLSRQDEHDSRGKFLCAVSRKPITSQPTVLIKRWV